MSTVFYKTINLPMLSPAPLILISDIYNGGEDTLSIKIFDTDFSFVIINGRKLRLNSGRAAIATREIPDGISEVVFVSGTKKLAAAPFFKKDRKAERVPIDSYLAKSLEEILISMSKKLLTAEERILALEEKITPKNMFKFN